MPRTVKRTTTTDSDGRKTTVKTIHKDRPRKTVDKEVRRVTGGATGVKKRTVSRTVKRK